tara:strand:- start:1300 stop:2385 length:1086 start_codon:yes stop_codon:yes gene_type:complete
LNSSGVKYDLLEEFEAELVAEQRTKKKKRILAASGIALGIVIGLFLAFDDMNDKPMQEQPSESIKERSESAIYSQPQQRDEEKEAIGQNTVGHIDEDFKAPGALMRDEPIEGSTGDSVAVIKHKSNANQVRQKKSSNEPSGGVQEKSITDKQALKTPTAADNNATSTLGDNTSGQAETTANIDKNNTPTVEKAVKAPTATDNNFASPSVPVSTYAVQVKVILNPRVAINLRDKLKKHGFDGWISFGKKGQQVYRVEVGKFKTIRQASNMSALLGEAGYTTSTSYINDGVTLLAGLFLNKKNAYGLSKSIRTAGFLSVVVKKTGAPSAFYMVRVGKYKTYNKAEAKLDEIKLAGFETIGIIK